MAKRCRGCDETECVMCSDRFMSENLWCEVQEDHDDDPMDRHYRRNLEARKAVMNKWTDLKHAV